MFHRAKRKQSLIAGYKVTVVPGFGDSDEILNCNHFNENHSPLLYKMFLTLNTVDVNLN